MTRYCDKCKQPFIYKRRRFKLCPKCGKRKAQELVKRDIFSVVFICYIQGGHYFQHLETVKADDVFEAAKKGWDQFYISKPNADYRLWAIKKVSYV